MSDVTKNTGGARKRSTKNTFTTKSGNSIRINKSLSEKRRASKAARLERKAQYLSTLPKNSFKRTLYRLHPKRVIRYWFSREGLVMALKLTGIGIVVCFLLIIGVFAYFRKDLPKINGISGQDLGGSITYFDRTGKTVLWQDYDAVKRVPVNGDQISKSMKQATVAIEDKDFYKHGAFDVRGIMRAAANNIFGGSGGTQGGSTITQQLVKLNEQWTNNRTMTRKVKELIIAVDLERQYSKDDILTGYLNIAPYGGIQYGVETAARDYFGESANKLTLAQAAMLAAIPKAPSTYSPYSPYFDKEALLGRQQYILDQMAAQKYITKDEAEAAKKVDVLKQVKPRTGSKYKGIKAPYFVLAAKAELEKKYGSATVDRGGWSVTTTLDMRLQSLADQQVQNNVANIRSHLADEQAFVAEDVKTGQIVALVGGVDFNDPDHGKINYAQHKIPPGSSFKPYDYVALINNTDNSGAGSVLYDTRAPLPGYEGTCKLLPKYADQCAPGTQPYLYDYDFHFPGPLTLRYALGGSRNVPAVKAMLTVGVDKTIETANALMGVKDAYSCYRDENLTVKGQCYASSAIGDGAYLHLDEHVNGLASLSRLGSVIPRTYILKITDASNKTIYSWTQPQGKQAVRPDAAYIINDMLSDPNASYLPYGYKFQHYNGWKFAVKTGTTNDGFDGLMVSYSTKYAVGTWVGYHNRQQTLRGAMEYMTEPVIRGWMEGAHDMLHTTPVNWTKPSGVQSLPAYIVRTHVGIGSVEPSSANDLFPSWYKRGTATVSSQTIDKVSGKLATSCTPASAKEVLYNSNVNVFSSDIFVKSGQSSGGAISATDDVHNCNDSMPTVILTAPTVCTGGSDCAFTVTVQQGTHPLSSTKFPGKIVLLVGGKSVKTVTIPTSASGSGVYTTTINYAPSSSGALQVSAQVTDSVLYTATSSATSVSFDIAKKQPDNSNTNNQDNNGGNNGNGFGNGDEF